MSKARDWPPPGGESKFWIITEATLPLRDARRTHQRWFDEHGLQFTDRRSQTQGMDVIWRGYRGQGTVSVWAFRDPEHAMLFKLAWG
jgi:hypothetical protein